jgi:hypothetical protein
MSLGGAGHPGCVTGGGKDDEVIATLRYVGDSSDPAPAGMLRYTVHVPAVAGAVRTKLSWVIPPFGKVMLVFEVVHPPAAETPMIVSPVLPLLRLMVNVALSLTASELGPLMLYVPGPDTGGGGGGGVTLPSHVTVIPPVGVTERPEYVQIVSPVDFFRALLWAET